MPDALNSLCPSNAIFAFCSGILNQKPKYGICICCENMCFILFDSKMHKFRAEALIECGPEEFHFLSHKSFLDTGTPVLYSTDDVLTAIAKGDVWEISTDMRRVIKAKVLLHGQLAKKWEERIVASF